MQAHSRRKEATTLENIGRDVLANICELKAAMLYYLSGGQGTVNYISISGMQYSFTTIMEDDFDMEELMDAKLTVNYVYVGGRTNSRTVDDINDITGLSGNTTNYIERYQFLKDSIPERQDEIRYEHYRSSFKCFWQYCCLL